MKRAAEGGVDPARGKRQKPTELGQYAFKVCCPEPYVAKVMSNRGVGVHDIEEGTSTNLQFSARGDFYPDTHLRICTVFGEEPRFLFEALTMMVDQVAAYADEERPTLEGHAMGDFADGQSGRIVFRCALSKGAAGAIIGSKGERVRSLRDSTGARVDIERDVVDNHQLVTVCGFRDQVLSVVEELNTVVQADADTAWFAAWAQQRGFKRPGGEAPPKRGKGGAPPPASWRNSDEHRGCTIFVGRLAQSTDSSTLEFFFSQWGKVVSTDVRIDQKTNRSKGFGFVTFNDPGSVEAVLNSPEQHTIDGRWVDVKRYGEDEDSKGGGKTGDSMSSYYEDEQHLSNHRGHGHDDYPGGGGGIAGPVWGGHPQGGKGSMGGASAAQPKDVNWFANLAQSVPQEYLGLDYCITCVLPSAKCGALIGKRGEHVAEVQRVTGATVTIGKKEQAEGPDGHRTITIVGQLIAVYGAHLMLMRYYNDAEQEIEGQHAQRDEAAAKVEELQRQIAELSKEVNKVHSGCAGGGGGKSGAGKSTRPVFGKGWGGKRK
eukprot:TRINITY_DN2917_c0_g2_i1.p1 TRINITY_DN2917_c0_g2~~TRINITY_DN2917_c0_g2_i1.p1  ORF type:complete len:568 (-),score=105.30 TRINITY_DN2917_c0_g2_i1:157-1788(-)